MCPFGCRNVVVVSTKKGGSHVARENVTAAYCDGWASVTPPHPKNATEAFRCECVASPTGWDCIDRFASPTPISGFSSSFPLHTRFQQFVVCLSTRLCCFLCFASVHTLFTCWALSALCPRSLRARVVLVLGQCSVGEQNIIVPRLLRCCARFALSQHAGDGDDDHDDFADRSSLLC